MSAKVTLIPKTTFANFLQLQPVLKVLIDNQRITKSQYAGVISLCSGVYPCTISLAQRTPKEMLYVSVNDQDYRISNRAKTKLVTKNDK